MITTLQVRSEAYLRSGTERMNKQSDVRYFFDQDDKIRWLDIVDDDLQGSGTAT